jgi:hypothetical protein
MRLHEFTNESDYTLPDTNAVGSPKQNERNRSNSTIIDEESSHLSKNGEPEKRPVTGHRIRMSVQRQ